VTTTDEELSRLERVLGRLLVTGVVVSSTLLTLGLAVMLIAPDQPAASWMLNAGLIVLMGTPILRVVVSFAEYVRLEDWFFVVATLVVIGELTITLLVAFARRG
jgi:uncharacterized membrane protein